MLQRRLRYPSIEAGEEFDGGDEVGAVGGKDGGEYGVERAEEVGRVEGEWEMWFQNEEEGRETYPGK